MMTKLLEKAFSKASKLSKENQDGLAKRVLAEIESEKRWSTLFDESQDKLAELAKETLSEHRKGKTKPLDLNAL